MNASSIIEAHGFLVFYQSQTGIKLNLNGDTLQLTNDRGELQDTETFPGILGYNMSVGRSIDGEGSWSFCTIPTANGSNLCPPPTITPVPPTAIPTETVLPTSTDTIDPPTPTIIPTLNIQPTKSYRPVSPAQKPEVKETTSSTTKKKMNTSYLGIIAIFLALFWFAILAVLFIRKRQHTS